LLENYSDVLTVDDVMEILHIGKNNTYRLLKDGTIKNLRIGNKFRVPKLAMIEYLNSCIN